MRKFNYSVCKFNYSVRKFCYRHIYETRSLIRSPGQRNRAGDLETQLVESLSAVKTIKQLNIEEFNNMKTETRFVHLLDSTYKSGLNSIFAGNASQFLTRAFTIVLLWAGSLLVIEQTIGHD